MRNTCVKLASVVVMLALLMTGCSLIEIDPVKQHAEDMEDLQKEYSTVLASYDGGEITIADVAYDYSNEYSYMSYLYSMYGYTMDQTQAQELLTDVVEAQMDTRAVLLQAENMGISLTDEELSECQAAAEEAYQSAYDTIYESVEGDTDQIKDLNTQYTLYANGQTKEFFERQQEWTLLLEKVEEVVKAEVTEVPEEDLEMLLTEHAIEDEELYANDLASFESAMMDPDTCVTWMPMGYRTVKHILLKVDDELLTQTTDARSALTAAQDELDALSDELAEATAPADDDESADDETDEEETPLRSEEEIQADIDAKQAEVDELTHELEDYEAQCVAAVQDKLDEIYAKLEEGEDFDSLMAEYGEDPGMQSDPAMTRGYYVCAESPTWDTNFRDAAMDLENVGDYTTTPVISSSGVHIIYYNSDVVGGQVSLDDIYDEFYEVALEDVREDHMTQTVDAWVEQLNPKYSVDAYFND